MSHISVAVGQKIRKIRELKGFSQDYVAQKLDLTQKAYSNIEAGKTKLDLERLENISKILDIEPMKVLAFDEQTLFNNYNQADTQTGSFGIFYGLKEGEGNNIYDARVKQLEEEVKFLREEITFLRSLVKENKK